MYIEEGCSVVIVDVIQPYLAKYIGTVWTVNNLISNYHPINATLYHPQYGELVLPIKCLEVIPPPESPLQHDELVKITKAYIRDSFHTCSPDLVGKNGKVRGFDRRNGYYYIKATNGHTGWFPIQCLLPLSYKGEHFIYPEQEVIYEDKKVKVINIKRTKFGNGLLLYIEGNWVPSSEVKPLP